MAEPYTKRLSKTLFNRICYTIFIVLIGSNSVFAVERYAEKYIDVPSFNLLPHDSIGKIYQEFGKAEIIFTPLAHNYMEYYDFRKGIELQFDIYQVDNSIWSISIRKTPVSRLSDNDLVPKDDADSSSAIRKNKPRGITLEDKLTKKGLRLGMTIKEVKDTLKTTLNMVVNEAVIKWEVEGGRYGGVSLEFNNGQLTQIMWYGVDP